MTKQQNFNQKFWEDKQGRVVVWQRPNVWLITWFVAMVLSWFVPYGWPQKTLSYTSSIALAIWATLELTSGVNYFRRLVGLLIAIGLALSFMQTLL